MMILWSYYPNWRSWCSTISSSLGATVLEKHFTYDKLRPGNDHYHAFDIKDLKGFQKKLEKIRVLYGESENINSNIKNQGKVKNARRSLIILEISRGDIIRDIDLIAKDLEMEYHQCC